MTEQQKAICDEILAKGQRDPCMIGLSLAFSAVCDLDLKGENLLISKALQHINRITAYLAGIEPRTAEETPHA